jgi:ubiquinone/menaquinone biosynthesis C-methylase UbiE
LQVPTPERALAVECGDGESALLIAREFPGARVRGVDSSPSRIQEVRARVGLDPEGRVAFKVGKPGDLPYPDGFFDLVAQVDGRPSPAEIARVLQPGAHLILARAQPLRFAPAAREKLLLRRLARLGIVPVHSAQVGNGNFFVGRLGGEGDSPPSN